MDGIEYIDASENNVITGMAIVSNPAYPEATATRLVAAAEEDHDEADDAGEELDAQPIDTERVNMMTLEEAMARIAELESDVQSLTNRLEALPAGDDPAGAEDQPPTVPQTEHDAAIAGKDAEIATLQQQLADLTAVQEELDELKRAQADAEQAQRKETLKAFAKAYGLDTEAEPIAQAIEALAYDTIVAAATEQDDQKPRNTAARVMADIATDDPYGGILDKTNQ